MDSPQFKMLTLIEDASLHIKSISCSQERILVGTNDGQLLLYDIRRQQQSPVVTHIFSHRQKVVKTLTISNIKATLVLTNDRLSMHSPTTLEKRPSSFDIVRQVLDYCVNQHGQPHYRVCVITRTGFALFSYSPDTATYLLMRTMHLNRIPSAVAWYRSLLYLGYDGQYVAMNDKTGETSPCIGDEIFTNTKAIIQLLPQRQILIAKSESRGLILNFKGEQTGYNLHWSNQPLEVQYSPPYIISLIENIGIEVHSEHDLSLLQQLHQPNIRKIFTTGLRFGLVPRDRQDPSNLIIAASKHAIYKVIRIR